MDYLLLEIPTGKGEPKKQYIPYCQFVLNDGQQVAVIAVDNDELGGITEINSPDETVTTDPIGKLRSQNLLFQIQLENSLISEGWNWNECPNPEVFLLTKNSNNDGNQPTNPETGG